MRVIKNQISKNFQERYKISVFEGRDICLNLLAEKIT
jgi:hypothetical protein